MSATWYSVVAANNGAEVGAGFCDTAAAVVVSAILDGDDGGNCGLARCVVGDCANEEGFRVGDEGRSL